MLVYSPRAYLRSFPSKVVFGWSIRASSSVRDFCRLSPLNMSVDKLESKGLDEKLRRLHDFSACDVRNTVRPPVVQQLMRLGVGCFAQTSKGKAR
jgi:hypothetical protein